MSSPGLIRRTDIPSAYPATSGARSIAPAAEAHAESYYPWFDWLRITLASLVVLAHAGILPESGNFSVQVFFALSGWLIGGILLRTKPEGMPRFYYLRATRIWIPYGVAFALLLGLSLMRDRVTPKYLEIVFYKATFVYNLFGTAQLQTASDQMPLHATGNHFWSICAEEQFYLVAPLLLVFLPRVGRALWPWFLLMWLPEYGAISAGVLAAVAHQRHPGFHETTAARVALMTVGALSAMLILTGLTPYELTVAPLAVSIVLLLARPGKKQKVAGFLGGVSYPLYLNHWIGLFVASGVARKLHLSELRTTIFVGLPLAFAVSAVLYLTVDKPLLARRNGWYSAPLGRRITVAAYGLMVVGLLGGAAYTVGPSATASARAPEGAHSAGDGLARDQRALEGQVHALRKQHEAHVDE